MIGLIGCRVVLVYLLAVERAAMVVANDVTSLCVLCIWVVLAVCAGGRVRWPRSPPGADSAAEEAVIVFGGLPADCPGSVNGVSRDLPSPSGYSGHDGWWEYHR
jgi:hypothetical protein